MLQKLKEGAKYSQPTIYRRNGRKGVRIVYLKSKIEPLGKPEG